MDANPRSTTLHDEILAMFDDFNRRHIATNPEWAAHVDDTGLVPWEELARGRPRGRGDDFEGVRRILTDEQVEVARAAEISDPEKLANQLSNLAHIGTGVDLPLSPLDMVVATTMGGAKYTKFTQTRLGNSVRNGMRSFNTAWVIDKVLSPATAITVTLDEVQRILHYGGLRAFLKYAEDKAMFAMARSVAAVSKGKVNPRHVISKLPKRWQKRLNALQDSPTLYKQAERQALDG